MAAFMVGSASGGCSILAFGQEFTPNVAGPAGSGSPGSANTATLTSVIVGYPSGRPKSTTCAILAAVPQDPTLLNLDSAYLAISDGLDDGSAFGADTNTRTYTFSNGPQLNVGQTYVLYLDDCYAVRCMIPAAYGGGDLIDDANSASPASMQFRVTLNT